MTCPLKNVLYEFDDDESEEISEGEWEGARVRVHSVYHMAPV